MQYWSTVPTCLMLKPSEGFSGRLKMYSQALILSGKELEILVKVFQKVRSTQSSVVVQMQQQVHHVTHLCSKFCPIDLLLAVRTPHFISGMRRGSALFSSKVLSVRGLHVLWNTRQMSQMSVRDVSLDLLPMLSHIALKHLSNSLYSHLTAQNGLGF